MQNRKPSAGSCRMTRSTTSDKPLSHRVLGGVLAAIFWIVVWHIAATAINQELLIPTPWRVLQTLSSLVVTAPFWKAVGISLLRICAGFLAALAVGSLLAVLTARFRLIRVLFSPLLHIVRAAPVASFIILTLVWIATDLVPVFISFLMVLPIVWVNVEQGIRRIDPKLKEVAAVYRLGHWRTFWHISVPSVMPFFLTAGVNGLGFAWKSGIAAEVICRPALSIGRELQGAKLTLETPEVFAWTAVVIALSIVLEQALLRVTNALMAKAGKEETHVDT